MIGMTDVDLRDRQVLIREDLNAPLRDGRVASDKRLTAVLPTLGAALDQGARVMVMSHLGRPTEGEYDADLSLAPVAHRLSELLQRKVPLVRNWLDGVDVAPGAIALCENVRFEVGEKANDEQLAKRMAALCDVFVMDAFATAHRAHASTAGVARYAPVACAGPLLAAELDALGTALRNPRRPLVAIVGGAKVSTKLEVLKSLSARVDELILGGGIANTIIAASGRGIGRSLAEHGLIDFAADLVRGEYGDASIPLPSDVVCAESLQADARGRLKAIGDVGVDEMILDIGPATAADFAERLQSAGTIVWNGPLGVFEHPEFAAGTGTIAAAVAASPAYSIAGGGDTLAAIEQFAVGDGISCISTGGGAFLEFLEGRRLPAVAALEDRGGSAPPGA